MVISQACFPAGIVFSSQAQIDAFRSAYPNCASIEGSVTILGEDIHNLYGLSGILEIGGNLLIGDDSVWSGNPSGSVASEMNQGLKTLHGLDSLVTIGGDLLILENDSLMDLSGLDALQSIGGELSIFDNKSLSSIEGLNNLSSLGGALNFARNTALHSLHGLENLTEIPGNLLIMGQLETLEGLNQVAHIGGDCLIAGNPFLETLAGLENLTTIEGTLLLGAVYIGGNEVLESLDGIEKLSHIGGDLIIAHNPNLSFCAISGICALLDRSSGIITIYGNAPGCNSEQEVNQSCLVLSTESVNISNVTLYPNPVSGNLYVENSLGHPIDQIILLDPFGEVISQIQKNFDQIDVSGLTPGIYFLMLTTGQKRVTQKIFVE